MERNKLTKEQKILFIMSVRGFSYEFIKAILTIS